jgi:F-type H+-transporting ATPase subunit b
MRKLMVIAALLLMAAPITPAYAAAPAEGGGGLMSPNTGLMFWTLAIFAVLWFILSKYVFPQITAAVEAREKALLAAIEEATRDREAAARLLEEHRVQIEAARGEAQRIIAEGRTTGEKLRAQMLDDTRTQQQEMLERARQEIGREKEAAIAELRKEAVDLAIRAAEKVVEKNLDSATNREIVDRFLASVTESGAASGAGAHGGGGAR